MNLELDVVEINLGRECDIDNWMNFVKKLNLY